jgi:hypothetical protein
VSSILSFGNHEKAQVIDVLQNSGLEIKSEERHLS